LTTLEAWLDRVHCMDARDLLAQFPAASVDLVCIDPPYNVSKPGQSVARNRGQAGDDISLDFGGWDYGVIEWQEFIPLVPRVLTDVGVLVCFCGSGTTGHAAVNLGRECVMGDSDEGFCRISRERIAAARLQPRMDFGRAENPTTSTLDWGDADG
jgi:DNA modification methylase